MKPKNGKCKRRRTTAKYLYWSTLNRNKEHVPKELKHQRILAYSEEARIWVATLFGAGGCSGVIAALMRHFG